MENRLDSTQPILNYLNWVPGKVGQGGAEEEPHSLQALELGQVPEGLCDLGRKSHTLWGLTFHLYHSPTWGSQDW